LYGLAQSKPMPLNNYRWLNKKCKNKIKKSDWLTMTEDQETGYIVEVDLEYPEDLHFKHNSFPLAPERLNIDREMLSPYAKGK
jgi:hypothetical protein